MHRALPLLSLLVACAGDSDLAPYAVYIAPAAGQTGVAPDLPLVVRTGSRLELPPDYPEPEFVRVIDLETGGDVPGAQHVDTANARIEFVPDVPWQPDHRYAWTVDPPVATPHGPEVPLPEPLAGTASFSTGNRIDVLGIGRDTDGRACLVLSRPVEQFDLRRITVDDIPVLPSLFGPPEDQLGDLASLWPGDQGLGGVCLSGIDIPDDSAVRVWWGDSEPWHYTLDGDLLPDVVRQLRRGEW